MLFHEPDALPADVRRALKDCRKDTEKRMKRYLDKDQYKEFKAVQESIHEELLARLDQA